MDYLHSSSCRCNRRRYGQLLDRAFHKTKIFDAQSGLFKDSRFIKRKHLEDAHAFYEKHGGKAIVLARFVPIIRTFAPFVAGLPNDLRTFYRLQFSGRICLGYYLPLGGYFFGNLPFVKQNFHYAVLAIIGLSLVPVVYEIVKSKRESFNARKKISSGH